MKKQKITDYFNKKIEFTKVSQRKSLLAMEIEELWAFSEKALMNPENQAILNLSENEELKKTEAIQHSIIKEAN